FGFAAFFITAMILLLIGASAAAMVSDDHPKRRTSVIRIERGPTYPALLANRRLMPLWIVTLLFSLAISPRLSFVAPYAYQQGIQRAGIYFFVYSAAAVMLRLFSGRF